MAYPRFQLARNFKTRRSVLAAHLSFASATWAELAAATGGPGTGGFDITLAAQVGDVVEFTPSLVWSNHATHGRMDVATIVSAAVVNTFSGNGVAGTTGIGVPAWTGFASQFWTAGSPAWYTVLAGDLSAGMITLRLYTRSESGTTKEIYTASPNFFAAVAKNLGPVDPN